MPVSFAAPRQRRVAPGGAGRRAVVFSASVGGGHDAAADALIDGLRAEGVRALRVDYLDLLPLRLGQLVKACYAAELRLAPDSWEWLCTAMHRYRPLARLLAALTVLTGRRLHRLLRDTPDLVVATYPMAGHALGRLRRTGRLASPVIAYLTDLSVHRLWIAAGVDTYLAPHASTAEAARALGARDVRVVAPAVRACFRTAVVSRAEARRHLGLPAEGRFALVAAGAWAVGDIARTVADLHGTGLVVPVVLCATNDRLRRQLSEGPAIALGWVDEMALLMRACDVLVSNAGGITALEALASGLPVTVYRCLPGHGRANAAAWHEADLATWVRRPVELSTVLRDVLDRPAVSLPPAPDPAVVLTGMVTRTSPDILWRRHSGSADPATTRRHPADHQPDRGAPRPTRPARAGHRIPRRAVPPRMRTERQP